MKELQAKINEFLLTLDDTDKDDWGITTRGEARAILSEFMDFTEIPHRDAKTYREFLIESGIPPEELAKVDDDYMDTATIESDDPSVDVVLVLRSSFIWDITPQGHEFWQKIANDLGGDY